MTQQAEPASSPAHIGVSSEQTLLRHAFPVLDSMRAVGALTVLTTHAAFWAGAYTGHGLFGTVLARMDIGVAIFFVLSGFLLARPHLSRAAAGVAAPGAGRYLWKRFLRIMPLYVTTVVLALIFVDQKRELGFGGWVRTLSMTNTFFDASLPDGLTQMWSLAVEVTFYLVLPLLMLVAVGRRRRLNPTRVVAVLLVLVAVSVWWHLSGTGLADQVSPGEPGQWLPGYLSWFSVGIFLALIHELHERGLWAPLTAPIVSAARQPGCVWAVVVGLVLVVATPLAGPSMLSAPTPTESLTKNVCYALVGGLLVLTGVFAEPFHSYTRLLSSPSPRHLGFISYGVFCLHLPILHFVMWSTGWPLFQGRLFLIWALSLGLSLLAAEASYRFVEGPAMRLKDLGRSVLTDPSTATRGTSIR